MWIQVTIPPTSREKTMLVSRVLMPPIIVRPLSLPISWLKSTPKSGPQKVRILLVK
ncbi:hypothetical protein D3C78_1653620 [compost metagenome]